MFARSNQFLLLLLLFYFHLNFDEVRERLSRDIWVRQMIESTVSVQKEEGKVSRLITQIHINRSWSLINSRWKCDYLAPCNLSADAWSIFFSLFSFPYLTCFRVKSERKLQRISSCQASNMRKKASLHSHYLSRGWEKYEWSEQNIRPHPQSRWKLFHFVFVFEAFPNESSGRRERKRRVMRESLTLSLYPTWS